jgi:hypothetical protein
LLSEITGLELSAPAVERAELGTMLEVCGWAVEKDAVRTRARGPEGFEIVLVDGKDARLRVVTMALTRDAGAPSTHAVGPRSTLRVGPGKTAVWTLAQEDAGKPATKP